MGKQASRRVQHVDDILKGLLLQIQEGKVCAIPFLVESGEQLLECDSHDTFFLKAPCTTRTLPEGYVERVKRVHEAGGYRSRGYNCVWKREEATKNLLRTHTTAVSSRMLYALAHVN